MNTYKVRVSLCVYVDWKLEFSGIWREREREKKRKKRERENSDRGERDEKEESEIV